MSVPAESSTWSRREFVTASALGIFGMASLARERTADTQILYVGAYTDSPRDEGVYVIEFDTRTGELHRVGAVDAGPNPSFLAIHPSGRTLYAVNEVAGYDGIRTGGVSTLMITRESGALTRMGMQSSGGRGPCYVSVDPSRRAALVANYDSGSVALLPIGEDGALGAVAAVVQHSGRGPNAERQEAPHAHCIVAHSASRFALAADLGTDRVLVYDLDTRAGTLRHRESGDARMHPGAGPRHIAFHPSLPFVFVTNELDSTVATLRFDADRGTLSLLSTVPTIPKSWSGENYPADVHLAPGGDAVYVSNRGHDSIAVFSIAPTTGALTLEQTVSTGGSWPRNFGLDPSGRWLVVANQKSSSLVVLARDPGSGRLTATARRLEVPSPACVRFGGTRDP